MNGRDREQFLMHCTRLGLNDYQARKFARFATTSDRLAEAACNGDWPFDNGERKVEWCVKCQSGMVRSKMVAGVCESCRLDARILAYADECGVACELQGDPRGWTVKLYKLEWTEPTVRVCPAHTCMQHEPCCHPDV
jgi:hypothetical protein